MASAEAVDGAPRAKRPRRWDGSEYEEPPLPLTDPSYFEGCTRWREFEAVGGRFEAPRSPRCTKEASFMAKCACGAVICQWCDEAQEATPAGVCQSCDVCDKVYACSRCLDSDVLTTCEGGCDLEGGRDLCEDCRSSCEDCDKVLCRDGDDCYTEVDGNKYCEDCYPKMVARTEEYYEEQRALWSEVHGEDYQPSDEEREAEIEAGQIRNELSRDYFY